MMSVIKSQRSLLPEQKLKNITAGIYMNFEDNYKFEINMEIGFTEDNGYELVI